MIHPDQWHPVDGLVLEPNALSAVTMSDRNVVVSAGPGAGKTELLAQRADFLLRTGQCPYPRRILAVSFKVDAARNLRERVRRRSGARLAARFDSFTFHAFAKRLIDNFRPALTGTNALNSDYRIVDRDRIEGEQITFGDLVPLALEIIETNAYARGGIRQTYSHVFLDEFQDCTGQQYRLIKAAFGQAPAVLTAVGDTKQRIMAWAGALDGVLQTFANDFSAQPLPLYQNFRSAPRLRRMQNRMIAQMDSGAVSPDEELIGDAGVIEVLGFDTEHDEAQALAEMIDGWLREGTPPSEIAILVRQQPHLVAAALGSALTRCGIAFRNEQVRQDLTAEPVAALVFNFIRVIADDRQPDAYAELMRITNRSSASDEEASRFDGQLKRMVSQSRSIVRGSTFRTGEPAVWRAVVHEFLQLVSTPKLTALSAGYQQGTRLDDLIEQALDAFDRELAVDGDAVQALRRLSEVDAIRILTIHKCKGLEFEKVVVLGVEEQLFWGPPTAQVSEFFVAVSRAKQHLVLTQTKHRDRPEGATGRWDESRTPHQRFLDFAHED
ncbi:DNA helicase [Streptomyces nojiriensis]|uniref:DNA 3'-5' helicase n=1 Tax=Streptomyces nojiriensis TaxID=66374 RepID=A0ABQ3SEI2_9ACTN|nr:ATP-dependent helicase [Streptomyces nojiriensis]QTI48171.1 DNA helicase II [Streptomyces nojiriensis]GGS25878.1 DNA helicase [Streptomyces nojiriensis]GHI66521.1 DNA helicase [Streptomyces nojiriensis]